MSTTLKPADITALIDSREQTPLDVSPLRTETATLTTGDYSVRGLESIVAIERKSLPDLLACCGRERERFDREVQRLLAYPVLALVVESSWHEIEAGEWRSQLKTTHVVGSLCGWIASGLPVVMTTDHTRAGVIVARVLFIAARRRWQEARALHATIDSETVTSTSSGNGATVSLLPQH